METEELSVRVARLEREVKRLRRELDAQRAADRNAALRADQAAAERSERRG